MRNLFLMGLGLCLVCACGSDSGTQDVDAITGDSTVTDNGTPASCPKKPEELVIKPGCMAKVFIDCHEMDYCKSAEKITSSTTPSGTTYQYHLYRDEVGDNGNRLSLQKWSTSFLPGTTRLGCNSIDNVDADAFINVMFHFPEDQQSRSYVQGAKMSNPDPCTVSAMDAWLDVTVTEHDTSSRNLKGTIQGNIVGGKDGNDVLMPIVGLIDATYNE